VRELEQLIRTMGSTTAPSQYSNASSNQELQKEIVELRGTVQSLQAQQRVLLEQSAPPLYN
jgi:hypothetical protein